MYENTQGKEAERRKRVGVLNVLYARRIQDPVSPMLSVFDFAAEPLSVRDDGRTAAAARAGRPGLSTADLQAPVRAAAGDDGRAEALSAAGQAAERRTTLKPSRKEESR